MKVIIFISCLVAIVQCQIYVQPEQIHLSLGMEEDEMVATWVTVNKTRTSTVEYGEQISMNLTALGSATLFTDGGPLKRQMYIHRVTMKVVPGKAYCKLQFTN